MTKEELRTEYVANGWEVQQVDDWTMVGEIEGKKKYDVNVVSPDDHFGAVQVIESNDGSAVARGGWEKQKTDFNTDLRVWLSSKEEGSVLGIVVEKAYITDEAAIVLVFKGTTTVTEKRYIVIRREGTFSFKEIV